MGSLDHPMSWSGEHFNDLFTKFNANEIRFAFVDLMSYPIFACRADYYHSLLELKCLFYFTWMFFHCELLFLCCFFNLPIYPVNLIVLLSI